MLNHLKRPAAITVGLLALCGLMAFDPIANATSLTRALSPDQALGIFLLDRNTPNARWDVAADGRGPIKWVTDGVKEISNAQATHSSRVGRVRIRLPQGELYELHRIKRPSAWKVELSSSSLAKFGPDEVAISNDDTCDAKCPVGGAYIARNRTKLKTLCVEQQGAGNGSHLYVISQPGKKSAFLKVRDAAGSGGHWQAWTLFWHAYPALHSYDPTPGERYFPDEIAQMQACRQAIEHVAKSNKDLR